MLLQLDDTLRGIVIGRQGATIKETQRVTGAMLTLPKRGETGPVRVSGPTAQTVMHAARLVARQTAAEQAEIACTCSVAGSDIAATLRYSHILFEGAGFVAFCLLLRPRGRGAGGMTGQLSWYILIICTSCMAAEPVLPKLGRN